MGILRKGPQRCSLDQHCSEWARIYLKYCLCNARDGTAFALGMISVVSWGLAEVPQIITNYKDKSTEGLSIAFLMTWIVGDLFNLIGCLLEPATLPTQFGMALLYTATTVILTGQTLYYGHIYPELKKRKLSHYYKGQKVGEQVTTSKENLQGSRNNDLESRTLSFQGDRPDLDNEFASFKSSPIPVTHPAVIRSGYGGRDLYFMSARSLSKSPIPTPGSWLAHSQISGRTPPLAADLHLAREPLLSRHVPALSASPSSNKHLLSVVSSAAFILVCFSFHLYSDAAFTAPSHGMVIKVSRKLLQAEALNSLGEGGASSGIGTLLGWIMAAIYMGGRLPQIWLNIQRGHAEGLNPFMFIFALAGNTTYVGSILVKSMDWSNLKPNMPWLVDAGGCVILDFFILMQFAYFHCCKAKDLENKEDN